MNPYSRSSFKPVLCVGAPPPWSPECLLAHGIGMLIAGTLARARVLLKHFRVAAIVVPALDLQALGVLSREETPIIVLVAPDSICHVEGVTLLARDIDCSAFASTLSTLVTEPIASGVTFEMA